MGQVSGHGCSSLGHESSVFIPSFEVKITIIPNEFSEKYLNSAYVIKLLDP